MEKRTVHNEKAFTNRAQLAEDIHPYFPKHTHDEVQEAMEDCEREMGDVRDIQRLVNCMKSRLAPQAADGLD